MGRGYLLSLILILISFNLYAVDLDQQGMGRRGFLRGLFGTAMVVAINPSFVPSAPPLTGLPASLKEMLVKLRLKTIYEIGPETALKPDPFLGLRKYHQLLRELAQSTSSPEHRAIILGRIKATEDTLIAFERVYARGANITQSSSASQTPETQKRVQIHEEEFESLDLTDEASDLPLKHELERLPLDVRIVTIRTLLGPDLLRKMAWQVHYSNPQFGMAEVLKRSDINFIQEYYSYLHQLRSELELEKMNLEARGLSDFGIENGISTALVYQFMAEARDVILAYYRVTKGIKTSESESGICGNYLNF